MHYTTEQKKQFLDEAISEYRTALEHFKKSQKLFGRCDIKLCTDLTDTIHVYQGIKKISALTGSEAFNAQDSFDRIQKNKLCVDVNDFTFFQLGDVKETVKGYYFG